MRPCMRLCSMPARVYNDCMYMLSADLTGASTGWPQHVLLKPCHAPLLLSRDNPLCVTCTAALADSKPASEVLKPGEAPPGTGVPFLNLTYRFGARSDDLLTAKLAHRKQVVADGHANLQAAESDTHRARWG